MQQNDIESTDMPVHVCLGGEGRGSERVREKGEKLSIILFGKNASFAVGYVLSRIMLI